ncbi:AzlD domain-containing protein [Aerophototrophica crusticola]|uniref:AzlD domain-containing protein n=1 Tax=Aerophototrophica crusticola TaxID=1709002 RepID=A0A858R6K3_9PROT|nr:AzlD domain-containing protein [Rhodospirillaceae bacterium B3]
MMSDPLILLAALAVAAAVTYVWRGLGVLLGGRIDPAGPLFEWVGCVAYALLAGLVARMILLPIGPLAAASLEARALAAAVGLGVFLLARRSLLLGLAAGLATLLLMTLR